MLIFILLSLFDLPLAGVWQLLKKTSACCLPVLGLGSAKLVLNYHQT